MFKNLETVVRHPGILMEYARWMAQGAFVGYPIRRVHGIRIGHFVNFSEFHSVRRMVTTEECEFFEKFDFGDGDIIDIGANLGLVSLIAARRFPDRRVIALEPAPSTFSSILKNVALNQAAVECLQLAISNHDGMVGFAAMERARANAHIVNSEASINSTIYVRARRLDTLVRELGVERIALIKIDTEGFEELVLRGATDVLDRIRPKAIYFEVCPLLSRRAGLDPVDAPQILEDAGYNLFELTPGHSLRPVMSKQVIEVTLANWVALRP